MIALLGDQWVDRYCQNKWTVYYSVEIAYQVAVFAMYALLLLLLCRGIMRLLQRRAALQRHQQQRHGAASQSGNTRLPVIVSPWNCSFQPAAALTQPTRKADVACFYFWIADYLTGVGFVGPACICAFRTAIPGDSHADRPATKPYVRVLDILTALFAATEIGLMLIYIAVLNQPFPIVLDLVMVANAVSITTFNAVFCLRVLRTAMRMAKPDSSYYLATRKLWRLCMIGIVMVILAIGIVVAMDAAQTTLTYGDQLWFLLAGRVVEWTCYVAVTLALDGTTKTETVQPAETVIGSMQRPDGPKAAAWTETPASPQPERKQLPNVSLTAGPQQ